MFMRIQSFIFKNQVWVIPVIFLILVLFATLRNYFLPISHMDGVLCGVTNYNNYIIFKNSFYHLCQGNNLYQNFPLEQYDLFKYTPTFALFFGVFSILPNIIGLFCWNLLNVFLPIIGFTQLIGLNQSKRPFLILLLIPEMLTSVLNSQSNGLILGLMLLSLVYLQRGNIIKAVVFIWLTAFIKIFGIALFVLFLFYPSYLKKAIIYGLGVLIILFCLPIVVTNLSTLMNQYKWFFQLIQNDSNTFIKYSVMAWLKSWFHVGISKNMIVMIGLLIQLLPIFVRSEYFRMNRTIYGLSWMIWVVIFNHMAESATFIIAVGAILVYLSFQENINLFHWIILLLLVVFTELGPSDIFPKYMRIWIVETAQLKVFPCILFWLAIQTRLLLNFENKKPSGF